MFTTVIFKMVLWLSWHQEMGKMSARTTEAEVMAQFRQASGHAAMPDDWTPVAAWIRVSGDKQDERIQVQEVITYCIQHKYWIVRWFVVHAKSASKGKQQKDLDDALMGMRNEQYHVLVIPDSSRLERREGKIGTELLNTLAEFVDAGGHVESVQEPSLRQVDIGSRVMTYITGVMNADKSKAISREVRRAHNTIRDNNAVHNRVPGVWYHKPQGEEYNKQAIPTEWGLDYWPQVIRRIIDGESTGDIAKWLDSEGVPTEKGGEWNPGTIAKLVHNPTFCGRRKGWEPDAPLLRDEQIVSVDLWNDANKALANHPKRGPIAKTKRPLLAKLKCIRCGSPMYRKKIGGPRSRRYNYRCDGQGPQRRGCGNLVPYEQTEEIVAVRIMMTSIDPYTEREWSEGWNYDSEIADTVRQIQALNPINEDDEARRPGLIAQLREYQRKSDEEAITGGWECVYYLSETRQMIHEYERSGYQDDELLTVGEHFIEIDDLEEQREYLAKHHDIQVERSETPDGPGVHVIIDGTDHGVFPYRQE